MIRRPASLTVGLPWVVSLLLACGAGGGDAPGEPPETHTVEIRNMEFHPAELRVNAGDTIVWVNRDFVPHTATAPDSAWTSPPLARGERWSMVAPGLDAGHYLCAFHPTMEARLLVDPSSATEMTQ